MERLLHCAFSNAVHLQCFLPFKDNLKHKLEHKMKIPCHISNEFLFDVLGCVSSKEKGLVDAEDEEIFTTKLESLREPWNEHKEAATKMEPIFHDCICAIVQIQSGPQSCPLSGSLPD